MDLTSVLTPDVMAPILANPEVQQRLMPYLPSGESLPQSSEELSNTLSSPQFQQVRVVMAPTPKSALKRPEQLPRAAYMIISCPIKIDSLIISLLIIVNLNFVNFCVFYTF